MINNELTRLGVDFQFTIRNKNDLVFLLYLFQDDVYKLIDSYYKSEFCTCSSLCEELGIDGKRIPNFPAGFTMKLSYDDELSIVENALILKTLINIKKLILNDYKGPKAPSLNKSNLDVTNIILKSVGLDYKFISRCIFRKIGDVDDVILDLIDCEKFERDLGKFMSLCKTNNVIYKNIFKYQWCLKHYSELNNKELCCEYVLNCYSAQNLIPIPVRRISTNAREEVNELLRTNRYYCSELLHKMESLLKKHRLGISSDRYLKETHLNDFYEYGDIDVKADGTVMRTNALLNGRAEMMLATILSKAN